MKTHPYDLKKLAEGVDKITDVIAAEDLLVTGTVTVRSRYHDDGGAVLKVRFAADKDEDFQTINVVDAS